MKTNGLNTLLELTQETRDKAAQGLATERNNQQLLHSQHESLLRYRGEYAQRMNACLDQGVDAATVQDYRRFIASLDDAIARAQSNLQVQSRMVDERRREWQQEQQRLASYETLVSRRKMQLLRDSQRAELRQQDEIANNLYLRAQLRTNES